MSCGIEQPWKKRSSLFTSLRNGVSSCPRKVSYLTSTVAISVSSVRGDRDFISDFSEEN